MRDIVLTALVFGLLPFILRKPSVGVLAWSWLSYMNPHRLTWGFAYNMPFAQIVAITLFVSLLFNKEEKRFPRDSIVNVWIIFLLWTMVTCTFAIYPDLAWTYEIKVFKIQIILFISLWMMWKPERIRQMVWVIYFSIGYFGIKGGLFTLLTGGGGRVLGPEGSFIGENNELAVAMLMVMPLGIYLAQFELKKKLYKRLMLAGVVLIAAAVIGSFSRGAFLAILSVGIYLWWRSPHKLITGVLGVVALMAALAFMPESFTERMSSIENYEEDQSANQRLNSWQYSINVASARFTGAGYESWSAENFARWAPNPNFVFVAHSIYFAVLADHGWVGLILFFTIFTMAWFRAGLIVKRVKENGDEEDQWMVGLAAMIKVSIVAYATGGAFLSLAYFDLPWHLVALIVLLAQHCRDKGLLDKKKAGPLYSNLNRA